MKKSILLVILSIFSSLIIHASQYNLSFKSTSLPEALKTFSNRYPDVKLTYIYNELDRYITSAMIDTDNPLKAIKSLVGLNPVRVFEKNGYIFVESYQKGKYIYYGRVLNEFDEPVQYANVLLLAPKDSTVITYAITGEDGRFTIPCDRLNAIAKISSTGYKTRTFTCKTENLGNLKLQTLAINLGEVNVEGDNARLLADRTVYLPLQRQKNISMSGIELLDNMAIPQIRINPLTGNPETNSGQAISLYIDKQPASTTDLQGMNMQDVRKVEFLEYPSDPRYQGDHYVVNFVMVQYEYGGYTRFNANENFILNSGMLQATSRFQYKKMTYDLSLLPFYFNNSHYGESKTETYRLPQNDGTEKIFERISETETSKHTRQQYLAAVKAKYQSDKVSINNTVSGMIDNKPHSDSHGTVRYSPAEFSASDYTMLNDIRERYLSYNGNFYFTLGDKNSLSITPRYSYTHTVNNSTYTETGFSPTVNAAYDNTNIFSGRIQYSHTLSKKSSFSAYGSGKHGYYRTEYAGTANSLDRSKDTRITAGVNYNFESGDFYGSAEFGWNWDLLSFNERHSSNNSPFANISLQYVLKGKNKISASLRYSDWVPSPTFKSSNIIHANHLMSYTGNPDIVPSKTYSGDINYTFVSSRKFNFSIFGDIFSVRDRYVYDYEATADGILRTIKQPMGNYIIGGMGVSATATLFDRKLTLRGSITQDFAHNGAPYNYTRWPLRFSLRANWYIKDFYITGYYSSAQKYSDGYMVGTWMDYKDNYYIMAGWANKSWNLRVSATNFVRWNWRSHKSWFNSAHYDNYSYVSDPTSHAYFSLSVTYTISYGKKVRNNDEVRPDSNTNSGILKN